MAFALPLVVIALATAFGGSSNTFISPAGYTNDSANQFLPLHAYMWDLLHGRAHGDVFWNWSSGYGVPLLPDYATYLSSPFAPLVALFPRSDIGWAMFTVSALKYATASAAMTAYLLHTYGGRRWAAPFFGLAFALCGWAVDDGSYVTMWLDSLWALPLLLLAGEWCLGRRRWGWAVLVVALAFWANFYTAYMVTLLGSCVLVTRALIRDDLTWGARLRGALRWAAAVLLGICLAAPILTAVYSASKLLVPTPTGGATAVPWSVILARLVPASEGVGSSPGLAVGTVVLLLALGLPAAGRVPARLRIGWSVLVLALVLSIEWHPSQLVWHGFESPVGSAYREAFVVSAVLVIAAWITVSQGRPGWPTVLLGGGLTALVVAVAHTTKYWNRVSAGVVTASLVVGALAYLALRLRGRSWLVPAAGVLAVVVLAEQTLAAVEIGRWRNRTFGQATFVMDAAQQAEAVAVPAVEATTSGRVAIGRVATFNDPLLTGSESGSYYSSLLPLAVFRQLRAHGLTWTGFGRAIFDFPADPATDAVFGVTRRVRYAGSGVQVTSEPAAPLLTWHSGGAAAPAADPFRANEQVLGASVYDLPDVRVVSGSGVRAVVPTSHGPTVLVTPPRSTFTLTGRCTPGSSVLAWIPDLVGTLTQGGVAVMLPPIQLEKRPGVLDQSGVVALGTTPASGVVEITVSTGVATRVTAQSFGCLRRDQLVASVAALQSGPVDAIHVTGHGFSARVHATTGGLVMMATTQQPGWSCSVDQGPATTTRSLYGFLASPVPAGDHLLSCTFREPRQRLGLAVFGGAVTLLLLVVVGPRLSALLARRRLQGATDSVGTAPAA